MYDCILLRWSPFAWLVQGTGVLDSWGFGLPPSLPACLELSFGHSFMKALLRIMTTTLAVISTRTHAPRKAGSYLASLSSGAILPRKSFYRANHPCLRADVHKLFALKRIFKSYKWSHHSPPVFTPFSKSLFPSPTRPAPFPLSHRHPIHISRLWRPSFLFYQICPQGSQSIP